MNFLLLTRRELEVINKKNYNYPLAIAEKDYFLTVVSKIIYDSPLREKLVFKGGTAIYHCYLNQLRFSEDLDFTSLDRDITFNDNELPRSKLTRYQLESLVASYGELTLVRLGRIKNIFKPYNYLEIKKEYISPATLKIERLGYIGPLGQPNSLKLEIDYKQNVYLPANNLEYRNAWKVKTKVKVMDIKEICAEKIRALSDRARYRDFYDLFMIFRNFQIDLKEVINIIKNKEMRKPISQKSIFENWKIAKQEKGGEKQRIYYLEEIVDNEIEKMIKKLKFSKIKIK